KPGKMCTDIGISKSILTGLKNGTKKNIQTDTAQKIADYFGVSVDRVLGSEQKEKSPAPEGVELTEDQIRAIEKIKKLPPEELAKKMAALEAVLDM
ncbi:MAG: helix-turn-helix domain-containing protein, partial [Elusimicrobiaceae bacterium]|nr:helix-turn-helix domain-containing protein [Elusimicrobiaceae bacterium]